MFLKIFCFFHLVATSALCTVRLDPHRIVDLTHAQDENALGFPYRFRPFKRRPTIWEDDFYGVAGQHVEEWEFSQGEHIGTHIDAPRHFVKGGRTVDQIPLTDLMAPGIVIDVRRKSDNGNENYHVTKEDFLEWENIHGRIPNKAIVFILTGTTTFKMPNNI